MTKNARVRRRAPTTQEAPATPESPPAEAATLKPVVVQQPLPMPVPRSIDKTLALRRLKNKRTLNDVVEDSYLALCENEEFAKYMDAVYDEQAVEGSLSADNVMAAQLMRDYAKQRNMTELSRQKLATISKALGVVMRRYGLSRKERRYTVAGELVPAPDGE